MDAPLPHVLLDWHIAAQPIFGQVVSGDQHLVKPFQRGVLLAVVDGVGHGGEATAAARKAIAILEERAQESVIGLVRRCHEALKQTRGVVMTLASFDSVDQTMTWLGVGNVEGRLLRAHAEANPASESALLRGGLVGMHLPALQAGVLPVAPGDLLVLATDGIRLDFDQGIEMREAPRVIAETILEQHFKGTDDALVLVARYLGARHD